MDAVDPHLVDQAEEVIRSTPGVVDVPEVPLRWHGHQLLAEARVTVDSAMPVIDANALSHRLSHEVEHDQVHGVRRLTAATIHPEPSATDSAEAHHLLGHHR